MPNLSIPTPELSFDAVDSGLAVLEKPIEIRTADILLPSGVRFLPENLGKAGFFIYRQTGSAAAADIWDETSKQWTADPGGRVSQLEPSPLVFDPEGDFPWKGMLVAAGKKDRDQQDQFDTSPSVFPRYFIRTFFMTADNGGLLAGLSDPSPAVRFLGVLDSNLAGLAVGEDETPANASRLRIFLRHPGRQLIGQVEIKRIGNQSKIEISNFHSSGIPRAKVILSPDGDITLEPAAGRRVVISGLLETEEIIYQPAGGGPKQPLNPT